MISSINFDHFLKNGIIEDLSPGTSMNILLNKFGEDFWYVKNFENNGLIYGIIKVGIIEFHIYNEMISGISYRPDIHYNKVDFRNIEIPWIIKKRSIDKIEKELDKKQIKYKKNIVKGPFKSIKTAGAVWIGIEDVEFIFIDTEGDVTILFEENIKNGQLEAVQICKYYSQDK